MSEGFRAEFTRLSGNDKSAHFMLLDLANGFNPVGLQTKNLNTFLISVLGFYRPHIQWFTGALPLRQGDRIVKLNTHLRLVDSTHIFKNLRATSKFQAPEG